MTTGQRIAAKRKEYKLSQEALGEQLGVSRQSIYKWESDASLPEIDKLVALSRLFSVSVGWLLGVEEAPSAPPPKTAEAEHAEEQAHNPSDLTPTQLKMVEEIVARYLTAQPKPRPRRLLIRVLAALAVVGVGLNLFSRLDQLDNRYNNLQNSIGNISSLHSNNGKDGQFQLPAAHGWIQDGTNETKFGTVEISSCQVGLFRNWQLVRWLDPAPTPENLEISTDMVYQLPALDISLEEGDILHFAAIFTDEYGRQGVAPSIPAFECMGDEISWIQSSDGTPYFKLENYTF